MEIRLVLWKKEILRRLEKMQEIAEELDIYKIGITALQ